MLSLGIVDENVEIGNEVVLDLGRAGTAARRRPLSSATSRSTSARPSAPFRTAKVVREIVRRRLA